MLSKEDIIGNWYKNNIIKDIVFKIGRTEKNKEDLQDLIQYISLKLLEKDSSLIQHLEETNSYRYFISRMVMNQLHSNTSDYAIERNRKRKQRDLIKCTKMISE